MSDKLDSAWISFERKVKTDGGNLYYLRGENGRYKTEDEKSIVTEYVWSSEAAANSYLLRNKLEGYSVRSTAIEGWIEEDIPAAAENNSSLILNAGTRHPYEGSAISAKNTFYTS